MFNSIKLNSRLAAVCGALAIGAGFGTQNLIKNLISGLMLLVERPIRMGDLVEVDGIKGRVTSIGIRFSTIHSADGVDTLIPNSELVEKKLVNWTYSNPDARREIRVGVAYGTDPVQVKNLIKSALVNVCIERTGFIDWQITVGSCKLPNINQHRFIAENFLKWCFE